PETSGQGSVRPEVHPGDTGADTPGSPESSGPSRDCCRVYGTRSPDRGARHPGAGRAREAGAFSTAAAGMRERGGEALQPGATGQPQARVRAQRGYTDGCQGRTQRGGERGQGPLAHSLPRPHPRAVPSAQVLELATLLHPPF
ncbi:hypothetical protein J6590_092028, partial [Homalodisca vitripennis]